jgi:DNA topoisomerase-1
MKSHANELDPKFRYLLGAPEQDPKGNPAIIRYSRKTKEQYVQSEIEGKASGWKAFYEEPNWIEEGEPKKPGAKKPGAKKKTAKTKTA